MTQENEPGCDDKARLEAIIASAKENPLYAPTAEKVSPRDRVVIALFLCLIALVVLAFIVLGLFLVYLMYIFWQEGVPLINCCGINYR